MKILERTNDKVVLELTTCDDHSSEESAVCTALLQFVAGKDIARLVVLIDDAKRKLEDLANKFANDPEIPQSMRSSIQIFAKLNKSFIDYAWTKAQNEEVDAGLAPVPHIVLE